MKNDMLTGKPTKQNRTGGIFIVCLFLSMLNTSISYAQGDLLLYPKRLVFDGSKRIQELNFANTGKETARYILSIVQIRMNEDGSFENIAEPDSGQNFADKFIRIFPRNVVLPPGEAQTVKVQISNSSEMEPGEYRSHIYVRAEEEKKPLGEVDTAKDGKSIAIQLVAVFGLSIPVIIQNGENNTSVKISEASFSMGNKATPAVHFAFNRAGSMSVYGDVAIDHITSSGKITPVGTAKGVAVYNPTAKRNMNIPLTNKEVDYRSGKLRIVYSYKGAKEKDQTEEFIALN